MRQLQVSLPSGERALDIAQDAHHEGVVPTDFQGGRRPLLETAKRESSVSGGKVINEDVPINFSREERPKLHYYRYVPPFAQSRRQSDIRTAQEI